VPELLNSLALVATGLAGGTVVGVILAAIARLMPGRRSLWGWAVIGGVVVAVSLAVLASDVLTGLQDAALSELERRELLDTGAFALGLCCAVVAGFVVGIVLRARSLSDASAKAPMAPLPPDLKIE